MRCYEHRNKIDENRMVNGVFESVNGLRVN